MFAPWRGVFYPKAVTQKRQLEFASRALTSIEVNGTYHGAIKRQSFAQWHAATPENFVLAVKAPRYATNRRVLAEAGASIQRFFDGGVMDLAEKLGPINWQFMATKKFDSRDFSAFLDLLPRQWEGRALRHAVEVRHESFCCAEFISLVRKKNVAVVIGVDGKFPVIADVTADFVYVRLMGTKAGPAAGYTPLALRRWASRLEAWERGETPEVAALLAPAAKRRTREVFAYVVAGEKIRNPAAAMTLIGKLGLYKEGASQERTSQDLSAKTILHGIKACDTMKKARSWLDAHAVDYAFHDYKTAGVTREKLGAWAEEVGWETVLNRAGTTFRKLPEAEKQGLDAQKAIALMLAQPSMIKRPVLEVHGKLVVGFKPEVYAHVFAKTAEG